MTSGNVTHCVCLNVSFSVMQVIISLDKNYNGAFTGTVFKVMLKLFAKGSQMFHLPSVTAVCSLLWHR